MDDLQKQILHLKKMMKDKDDKLDQLETKYKKICAKFEITSLQKMGPLALNLDTVAGVVAAIRNSSPRESSRSYDG